MRAGIVASISGALVVILLGLVVFGGKPVPVGTWQGTRALPMNPGTDPLVADQLRRVRLTIDASGNGDLEDGGIPSEGLVSWEGNRLKFEVVAKLGINIAKQPPDEPRWLYFMPEGGALVYGDTRLERTR